jgi:hypothetical protein
MQTAAFRSFLKHIEYTLLDANVETLTPSEIQHVVQFNIRRKQLLEQLTHLLHSHCMTLGILFRYCSTYMGMYAMFVDSDFTCFVSKDHCQYGRYVVFCQKLNTTEHTLPESVSLFLRNDIFLYVRFFYFITHFNFYVTRVVMDTTHDERWGPNSTIIGDLQRKYESAAQILMSLVIPLESI